MRPLTDREARGPYPRDAWRLIRRGSVVLHTNAQGQPDLYFEIGDWACLANTLARTLGAVEAARAGRLVARALRGSPRKLSVCPT